MLTYQLSETILHCQQMEYSRHCQLPPHQFTIVKFLSKQTTSKSGAEINNNI
jgi:hypothetical protein